MPAWGANNPFRHRGMFQDGYTSPYLLEILSSRNPGWPCATGTLTAEAPGLQVVSCSRASSAYCLGRDGLLHLLGANTVRVEPSGLLVEGARTNMLFYSDLIGFNGTQGWQLFSNGGISSNPVRTANTTDVTDPTGGNAATKVVFSAVAGTDFSAVYDATSDASPLSGVGAASIWARAPAGQSFSLEWANNGHTNAIVLTDQWQRFTYNVAFGQIWVGNNAGLLGPQPARTAYFWGAQLEDNAPFASSNILTNGAAATRAADVVTVANPLNPSNPGTWRVSATATPLATWSTVLTSGSLACLLNTSGNNAPNNWRLYADINNVWWDTYDNAGGNKYAGLGALSGSGPTTFTATDAAGTLTFLSPGTPGTPGGAGTGIMGAQQATLYLGQFSVGFQANSHLTDIYVNNT